MAEASVVKATTVKKSDLPPIKEIFDRPDVSITAPPDHLFLSSIESYYLFEHLRGWTNDVYLEFDANQNKLKQVHVTGKRIEDRMKQLGLDYSNMFKLEAKKGAELYSAISQNRANGYGTEVSMELKGQEIDTAVAHSVRGFDF